MEPAFSKCVGHQTAFAKRYGQNQQQCDRLDVGVACHGFIFAGNEAYCFQKTVWTRMSKLDYIENKQILQTSGVFVAHSFKLVPGNCG